MRRRGEGPMETHLMYCLSVASKAFRLFNRRHRTHKPRDHPQATEDHSAEQTQIFDRDLRWLAGPDSRNTPNSASFPCIPCDSDPGNPSFLWKIFSREIAIMGTAIPILRTSWVGTHCGWALFHRPSIHKEYRHSSHSLGTSSVP